MPPNPDIAHIVFLKGYMEKIGRGTLKIIEACKEANLQTHAWSKGSYTVTLTFFNEPTDGNKRDVKPRHISDVKQHATDGNENEGATEGKANGAIEVANGGGYKGATEGAIKGAVKGAQEKAVKEILETLIIDTLKGTTDKVKDNLLALLYAIYETEGKRVPDLNVCYRNVRQYGRKICKDVP